MSSALAFYDGYSSEVLPANLIQAQRDYFGAHTYELLTMEGNWVSIYTVFFCLFTRQPNKFPFQVHTNWTGKGGRVTSNAYSA